MSDYMFMLDSHLNAEQSKALAARSGSCRTSQSEPVSRRRRDARHDGRVPDP